MQGRPLSYTVCADGLALVALSVLLSLHRPLLEPLPELLWGPLLSSVLSYSFNRTPTFLACSHAPAVRQDFACKTCMLLAVFADDGDIRNMNRSFLLNDSALDVALGIRARVTLDHLNALDHDLLVLRDDDQNAASLPAVLAAKNVNLVIFFDCGHCRHLNDLRSQ